ncbi:MAG: hypothetical protein ACYDG2_24295 [Ruminiclostridium sp.]
MRDIKYVKNYIWIFILLVGNFVAYYFLVSNKSDFASNFLLNFGTGLLQTIIIVILIERKLLKQQEENRQKMQAYALKSLRISIYNQLDILFSFILSSVKSIEKLGRQYNSIADLLKSNFSHENIQAMGFFADHCDAHVSIIYIRNINKTFKDNIIEMLSIYSSYLDSDLMNSITIILHNSFFNTFNDSFIYETLKNDPDHQYFLLKGQNQSIREYINELISVIEKYNSYNKGNKIDINVAINEWLEKS